MTSTKRPDGPRFTSVKLYKHASKHLTFWYPPEWGLLEADDPHPAVSLYPEPPEEATFVSIAMQDMGQPIVEEERALLAEGVQEGLESLDTCEVQRLETLEDAGDWCQEWVCTFVQDGTTRKRRARLFCEGQHLYSIVLQGATEERYEYWRRMMEWLMLTVLDTSEELAGQATSRGEENQP